MIFFVVDGTPEDLRGRIADAVHSVKGRIELRADVHIEEVAISDVKRNRCSHPNLRSAILLNIQFAIFTRPATGFWRRP